MNKNLIAVDLTAAAKKKINDWCSDHVPAREVNAIVEELIEDGIDKGDSLLLGAIEQIELYLSKDKTLVLTESDLVTEAFTSRSKYDSEIYFK
jgi:hypothetical protein